MEPQGGAKDSKDGDDDDGDKEAEGSERHVKRSITG